MGVRMRPWGLLATAACLLPVALASSPFAPEYYCVVELRHKPAYSARVWRIALDRKDGGRLHVKSASFYLFDRPSSRKVDAAALDVPRWTDERGVITLEAVDYDTRRHYVLQGTIVHQGLFAEREGFVTVRGSHREYRGAPSPKTLVVQRDLDLRGNPAIP